MSGTLPNPHLFDPNGVPFAAAASMIQAAGPILAVYGIDTDSALPQPAEPYDPYAPMPPGYGYGPGWVDAL